ncbi:MAG TPA: 2-C-methyl-D-erythritol 4-phosphate cytidylyltransferase, partial [Chitinophagaceae bacterium]|nr:2-C-methyl-D-erythritol 4-phosphate cytidylyltransferase [Chitinophagaceae bacterium]
MNYAILVAAGSGNRMNSQIPKQYMLLKDKPLLYYTVHRFLQFDPTLIIILVLPEGDQQGRQMMEQYFPSAENIRYIAGGSTRFHSVQNGLRAIPDEEGIVWIHDGVRPFVSEAVLKRCRNMALEQGVAIPAIQLKDSLRKVMKTESQALNRSEIVAIQTPQTFQIKTIKKAF